jgi:hypothetical protein
MHGLRDLAATAEGETVDGGDHGFSKCFQPRSHRLTAPHEIADRRGAAVPDALRKFMDVGAGREGAVASAGQDDGMHRGVGLDPVQQGRQFIDQCVVQRIQPFRSVERQKRDVVVDIKQHGLRHSEPPK